MAVIGFTLVAVKDVIKINRVIGIGTTLHKFKNDKGKDVFLPCVSYHPPTTDVRLFSPQTYHQMHGGNSYLCGGCVEMNLKDNIIVIPIHRELANLPILYKSFVSAKEKKEVGPQIRPAMHRWELPGNYPVFTVVMVIYHYVERIWRILVTPVFCITYMTINRYYSGEPVNIHIQSLINIIQDNNRVITTKKG